MLRYPNSNTAVLDVNELAEGIYTVEIITEKQSFKKQLIIQ